MDVSQTEAVTAALLAYWTARNDAAEAQAAKGAVDQGARSGVTAGGHMNWIAALCADVARSAGAHPNAVFYAGPKGADFTRPHVKQGYTLPGWFRPTKEWDVVVYDPSGDVIAAIELKSQNGPSYSNNANNRMEEAIGNSYDLKKAVVEGLIPAMPWMGYVYVIEDDVVSTRDCSDRAPSRYPLDNTFLGWTYTERVRLLAKRLVEDNHYDSAWAVKTSRPECGGTLQCPVLTAQDRLNKKAAKIGQKASTLPHAHTFSWCEMAPGESGFAQFAASLDAAVRPAWPPGTTLNGPLPWPPP